MPPKHEFILGEFQRTIDERHRLSIPAELADPLTAPSAECILAKERPGALSLWNATAWGARFRSGLELVQHKVQAGRLEQRIEDVQLLGRLLSTRHTNVQIAARGRLLLPEGFRQFLGVEPGGEVMIIGAGVCVELWNPREWVEHLRARMPDFSRLLEELAG